MPLPSSSAAQRAAIKWLDGRMIDDLIPDYVAGRFANDPASQAAIEEILQSNPDARAFHTRYTAALGSRTSEQWKSDAETAFARIQARLTPMLAEQPRHASIPAGPNAIRPRAVTVAREGKWFVGFLENLGLLPTQAFTLRPATDVDRKVWALEMSQIGLSETERRARIPWAGDVVQITQSRQTDGSVTYSAYVEPSDDQRPHGVLLFALRSAEGIACEVRLTKNSRKKLFPPAVLPDQPSSLRFALAIE